MRLFVALRPPAAIRAGLADAMEGVGCARWQDDDQLHLTLRFLGEVDRRQADDLAAALDQVHAPIPTVALAGVGRFADSLWAALAPAEALASLHRKVDHACVRAGFAPERRAYLPHVTLARFARSRGGDPEFARWLTTHAALASPAFTMPHLILYRSTLGHGGASYDALARWPLGTRGTVAGSLP
ncbi:RNA 2',3'-cyclic phosphodiesterase [Sphingomonas sp.]|uniref:RNA 2',3'-cyclic phosphodiesterase n=1 Tax=Sphingomonas sp. TaxID=28214 RepID=UPI0035BC080F